MHCCRIGKGEFEIDGIKYRVPINNGPNSLHGGHNGFDKKVWSASVVSHDPPAVQLSYLSPEGEEGYPGKLNVSVTYTVQNKSLVLDYYAELEPGSDKKSIVNL